MLYGLIVAVHIVVCFILILVVLLQSGKGADLAGAFGGGGSQTAFGSRGPASFLSRMTTVAAILFMVTSITLSGMGRQEAASSVLDGSAAPAVPAAAKPAAGQPQQGAMPTPEEIKRKQAEIEAKQGAAAQGEASKPEPGQAEPSPGKPDSPPPNKP